MDSGPVPAAAVIVKVGRGPPAPGSSSVHIATMMCPKAHTCLGGVEDIPNNSMLGIISVVGAGGSPPLDLPCGIDCGLVIHIFPIKHFFLETTNYKKILPVLYFLDNCLFPRPEPHSKDFFSCPASDTSVMNGLPFFAGSIGIFSLCCFDVVTPFLPRSLLSHDPPTKHYPLLASHFSYALDASSYLWDTSCLIQEPPFDVSKYGEPLSNLLNETLCHHLHRHCVDTPIYILAVLRSQRLLLPLWRVHCGGGRHDVGSQLSVAVATICICKYGYLSRWHSLPIPVYTVVMPRPLKPPLLTRHIYRESKNNCTVDSSTSRNPQPSRPTQQIIAAYKPSSRNITRQIRSHRNIVMALDLDAPTIAQWLDHNACQPLYDFRCGPVTYEQDVSTYFSQAGTAQGAAFVPPRLSEAQPSRKRRFSSITDPNEQDCHSKTNNRKQRTASRGDSQTKLIPTDTSSPSYTREASDSTSPSPAASRPKFFACPFSKGATKKCLSMKDWKSCLGSGPGWDISRLKEHLTRKHASPNSRCPRCQAEFKSNPELDEHLRSTPLCSIKPKSTAQELHILDAEQILQLKKRSRRLSDEEKWKTIYRIVFRLGPTAETPSPYYEDSSPNPSNCGRTISQFQSYLECLLQDGHENASAISTCLDFVQDFLKTPEEKNFPIFKASPLVFDDCKVLTTPHECSSGVSITDENNVESPHTVEYMDGLGLSGSNSWVDDFGTHNNQAFGVAAVQPPVENQTMEGFGWNGNSQVS